ncbi:FadR/GntR family transcriptional regulator [Rubellimicrobium rubrum]|uniref:FadR/GntR family transcriptional regulator n=1 Tax=Rubellimicrobium rubrum TaxID=2585369 RepID=UPI001FE98094|nr:FCD domain-containing protein [Rubellimicrobium rubrum]
MDASLPLSASEPRVGHDVMDGLVALVSAEGLKPGDRLPPETELARRLGVGRHKLREVLTAWARVGIVSRNKGAGTVLAAPITGRTLALPLAVTLEAESLLRTLAVRRPLEIEAVRLAARDATQAARDQITARMLDLMVAFDGGADWRVADRAFHAAIHDATGNPLFSQIIGQLQRAFDEVYQTPFGMPQLGSATIPLHRPLAEAVVAGQGIQATEWMTRILDDTEAAARAVMEGHG